MICDIFPCQIDEKLSKEIAIKENVFNSSLNINIGDKEDSSTPRLFTKFAKLWKAETALKISFLNGSTSDRNYVENIARVWEQYCNI
nr:hypothetical protein [Bacteroidota bacterium]